VVAPDSIRDGPRGDVAAGGHLLREPWLRILIDPSSIALISGTTIDFVDGQEGTGFSFDNPHAKSKGGCSKSCCNGCNQRKPVMRDAHLHNSWVYLDNNATTRTDRALSRQCFHFYAARLQIHLLCTIWAPRRKTPCTPREGNVSALIGAERESEIVFTSVGASRITQQSSRLSKRRVDEKRLLLQLWNTLLCLHCVPIWRRQGEPRSIAFRLTAADSRSRCVSQRSQPSGRLWSRSNGPTTKPEFCFPLRCSPPWRIHRGVVSLRCRTGCGRVEIKVNCAEIDMVSISAHKMHGRRESALSMCATE